MIDDRKIDRKIEARAEQGRASSVSPLASTMPTSLSNSGANREGFARLHSLSDRVSTIKNALEDIVNGRAYADDLPSKDLTASITTRSERADAGRGGEGGGGGGGGGGALSSLASAAIKPTVHLSRHGSVDIMLPGSAHQ